MTKVEKTPGQIYDSNFSIRTTNTQKHHPDWSEEKVCEDAVQTFGTRDEFIRRWLGYEGTSLLDPCTPDDYETMKKHLVEVITKTDPLLVISEAEQKASDMLGPMDQWIIDRKGFNQRKIGEHYKTRKRLLRRLLAYGEITEDDYQKRMSKLKQWFISSREEFKD